MATQAEVNLKGIADNKKFADTNDPNYRFVNFFNLKESRAWRRCRKRGHRAGFSLRQGHPACRLRCARHVPALRSA